MTIGVWLNGEALEPLTHEETELFTPVAKNFAYPAAEVLKFYAVPLNRIIAGKNTVKISKQGTEKPSCDLRSMELALYHEQARPRMKTTVRDKWAQETRAQRMYGSIDINPTQS